MVIFGHLLNLISIMIMLFLLVLEMEIMVRENPNQGLDLLHALKKYKKTPIIKIIGVLS